MQVALVWAASILAQEPDVNPIAAGSLLGGVHRLMDVLHKMDKEFQRLCPLLPVDFLVRQHSVRIPSHGEHHSDAMANTVPRAWRTSFRFDAGQ